MEVDLDDQQDQAQRQSADRKAEEQALDEFLTNPLRFISALASAASGSAAASSTPGQAATPTCRKRKEAEDPAANKKARFEVKLNVEGYKAVEMNIKLIDNSLIISGSHESTDESGSVTRNFTRKWNIPENVLLEELTCNFNSKDNTMNISAPWKVEVPAEVKEKVIPINVLTAPVAEDKVNEVTSTPTPTPPTSGDEVMDKGTVNDPTVGA